MVIPAFLRKVQEESDMQGFPEREDGLLQGYWKSKKAQKGDVNAKKEFKEA